MTKRHRVVVVDGSNLATEGRTQPSLRQLEDAVKAFTEQNSDVAPVIVVDATFEHRVAPAERQRVEELERAGELVSPPAGTVGRGDAFILEVAKRANAAVLSNDSFQEFHQAHPWLFDDGRLVGGKPVPRVGWIFTLRSPVRGPRSRAATKAARSVASEPEPKPAEAVAKRSAQPATARRAAKGSNKAIAGRAKTETVADGPPERPARAGSRTRSQTPRKTATPASRVGAAAATAAHEPAPAHAPARRKAEPVNTARSFARLVADHKVGGMVEGEVLQFTSHGAMVAVRVGKTMRVVCYAPLAGLGTPPPTRARDVLKKGEKARFAIVAFDDERRRAELALQSS